MPIPQTASPIIPARVLLKDAITETIRDAILSGELEPGASLTDIRVAEQFGGTRASVRAALRRLAGEGLVVVRPQVGTRVREVAPERTRDALVLYRGITESTARMLVDGVSDDDLARLRERAEAMRDAQPGVASVTAFDAFYDVLLERVGNALLRDFHTQIVAHLVQAGAVQGITSLHRPEVDAVIAAAESRDAAGLERAIDAHFALVAEAFDVDLESGERAATQTTGRVFLRDQVYFAIRDAITDGVLEPGERLREDEIVEWLGSSRASIRDALARLSDERLVEMVPNQFTRVAPADRDGILEAVIAQFVFFRIALSEGAPRLAEQDRAELQQLADGVLAAVAEGVRPSVYLASLGNYERALARAADNEMLRHYIDQCAPLVSRALSIPGTEVDLERLGSYVMRINEAVLAGEAERAVELLREFAAAAVADLEEAAPPAERAHSAG